MLRPSKAEPNSVFLNVPYDPAYEPLFIALICSLVALGRTPRCVLEVPDSGQGRLNRIFNLLASCRLSIHDLSRVEDPPRFNMPFELGMAVALSQTRTHGYYILEAQRHRVIHTLSDINLNDASIHNNNPNKIISKIFGFLGKRSGNPDIKQVKKMYQALSQVAEEAKNDYEEEDVFDRPIFLLLVSASIDLKKKYLDT